MLAAIGLVVVLVCAGCGSDVEPSGSPTDGNRSDEPAVVTTDVGGAARAVEPAAPATTLAPNRSTQTSTPAETAEAAIAEDETIETVGQARSLLATTTGDVEAPPAISGPTDDGLRSLLDGSITGEDFFASARAEPASRLLTGHYLMCDGSQFGRRCTATVADYLDWTDRCRRTDGRLSERLIENDEGWAGSGVCYWAFSDDLGDDARALVTANLTDRSYRSVTIGRFEDVANDLAVEMVALNGTADERDLTVANERLQAGDALDVLGPADELSCKGSGYYLAPRWLDPSDLAFLDELDDGATPGRIGIGVGVAWSDSSYEVIVCYQHFG